MSDPEQAQRAERRKWARIEASLECTIATADLTFDAKVVNVSRSGVAVMARAGLIQVEEPVTVMLDQLEGGLSLGLSGTVARIVASGADTVYGIHFEALPPDTEQELVWLLRMLAGGKGGGRREHPRVSARIAVKCKSKERFDALLNDLSRGGFSIRCPAKVEQGALVEVEFGVGEHSELLTIEGDVTHVETLPDGKRIAGLRFTPPTLEQRQKVQQLLELLLGLG